MAMYYIWVQVNLCNSTKEKYVTVMVHIRMFTEMKWQGSIRTYRLYNDDETYKNNCNDLQAKQ